MLKSPSVLTDTSVCRTAIGNPEQRALVFMISDIDDIATKCPSPNGIVRVEKGRVAGLREECVKGSPLSASGVVVVVIV